MQIKINPLSVNSAWKGRRFKTDEYKKYESDVLFLLPKMEIAKDCKIHLHLYVGF